MEPSEFDRQTAPVVTVTMAPASYDIEWHRPPREPVADEQLTEWKRRRLVKALRALADHVEKGGRVF